MSKNKNYFRHHFRAHQDDKIDQLIQETGMEGYGRWWILVELCAAYIDDNAIEYENIPCKFHLKRLREVLRMNARSLKPFLNKLGTCLELVVNLSETSVVITIPNLSKYLGSYKKQNAKIPILKERKGKKSKQKKTKENASEPTEAGFDFEALYQAYPHKVGKRIGLDKLKLLCKDQKTYDAIIIGIKNYTAMCKKSDRKFKDFSTFVNQRTWEEFQEPIKSEELLLLESLTVRPPREVFNV